MVDDSLDPQGALDRPRFQLNDGMAFGKVLLEAPLEKKVSPGLYKMGHETEIIQGEDRYIFGLGQIIMVDKSGVLWGGSDPRGDGYALGVK